MMDKLLYRWGEEIFIFHLRNSVSFSSWTWNTLFCWYFFTSHTKFQTPDTSDIKQHSLSYWKEYRKFMLLLLNIHYFSLWMLLWHLFVLLQETFSHFYASALCMCPCELNGLTSNLLGLMIKLLLFTLQESSHSHAYYSPLYTPMSQSGREQNEQKLERLRCDSDREFAIY